MNTSGRSNPPQSGRELGTLEYSHWTGIMTYTAGLSFDSRWEETTNARSNFFAEQAISRDDIGGGGDCLRGGDRRERRAKRGRRGKGPAVRDRVLLQSEMGPRGRVSRALQEKSLSGAEERDGTRGQAKSNHGDAALSHDRRRALGLPRDHRVQERGRRQRQFRQLRHHQAALSRPGNVQEGRTAAL